MTMSQANSVIDKDQSKLSQQLQCDTTWFAPNGVQQSQQQEQMQPPTRRTSKQLSEAERVISLEIDKCLKNWYEPWKQTYLDDGPEFSAIYDLMEGLLYYQDQIQCNETVLPADRSKAIAHAVARLIDYGNAILNIDITLRANDGTFRELDPSSMTTIELYHAHIKAHRLRDKLMQNYFKTASKRNSHDSDSPTGTLSQQQSASYGLRVPTSSPSSNLPSPVMDRSQRFSIGSNSSINTLVPNANANASASDGRRTPQALNPSLIEVRTMSSTEDLTEGQLEMRHLVATLESSAFRDLKPSTIRVTLLQAALSKIESLLSLPSNTEKLTNCFKLLDCLLDSIERIPMESRRKEVQMIAKSLLKTLVRKVYVDDRDNYVEFQRSHWSTYLISLVRMMSATEFSLYLKEFSNSPDLSAFLRDYLFIIKRLISRPNELDGLTEQLDPVFPECWIEMSLLVCSTLLKSLIFLYQILRSAYPSNVPMWLSYIDCLVHFILQDMLKPDRVMLKQRQLLLADDLRRTAADYVWITWDSLNINQKYEILEDLIEPLLRVCLTLNSRQRSILLPIFHDMMQCDYTNQYMSPRATVCGSAASVCSQATVERIGNQVNYLYEAELEHRLQAARKDTSSSNETTSGGGENNQHLLTINHPDQSMARISSDESLPYLSFTDQPAMQPPPPQQQQQSPAARSSTSDDGTVLTKFTHLIVGKLYILMVDANLGDDQFKREFCAAISGEPTGGGGVKSQQQSTTARNYTLPPDCGAPALTTAGASGDGATSQFKCMAKHTANLISEFVQICLDSRQANKLSYNHLHLLCLFKLILFFRDKVDRIELYLANLHKLWRLHHNAGRFVEAGFTLLELAKSLPWSNKPLEGHYRIVTRSFQTAQPLSNHTNLKLFLYTTIIEYFDQAQLWEPAVPLCRELVDVYQFKLFDYPKLAQILAKLAAFFNSISSGVNLRSHPEYFRVTFYGSGFPECLRSATMIYRGKPYEKLSDFQATLLAKYPDAKLLRTLDQPEESLLNEFEAKYLQINACTPLVDLKSKFIAAASAMVDVSELHDYILAYYKHNECDKFEFSRRINATAGGGGDDFANMWRQRVTLTTNSLPGMLPFFSVFVQETNIISPIECAIEDLERANDRLSGMVNRFKADKRREEDVRPLGQLLLGIVDAAVNGGIAKYEQAFFNAPDGGGAAGAAPASATSTMSAGAKHNNNNNNNKRNSILATTAHGERTPLTSSGENTARRSNCDPNRKHLTPTQQLDGSGGGGVNKCNTSAADAAEAATNAPSREQVERLKRLIAGQVPLLDEAIRLHAERVADVMRPQHEHLEGAYKRLKHHVMSKYPRYLPAHYHRNSTSSASFSHSSANSSTLRTYRSLARSPNRSIRSESAFSSANLPALAPDGDRSSFRRDDGGRASDPACDVSGERDQSKIPYMQLNNERKVASASGEFERGIAMSPQVSPRLAQGARSRLNSTDLSAFERFVPPPPPPPPPKPSNQAAQDELYGSTYVPVPEVGRLAPEPPPRFKTTTPSQFTEAPYAHLLLHDDDDNDELAAGGESQRAAGRPARDDEATELVTI